MTKPVVIFDQVSKKFARGERHTTLRDFLPAMASRLWPWRRRPASELRAEEFWAVNNVSFSLTRGQALGVIGPNGSGKSTILKLLSGIIKPDLGTYRVEGRLSALIEVGAGFHPDLTGRENVYLNGCILGMTRKEVAAKFNRIIEFAGVEEFIDTPLKRYSSGMAVRLGFAVSATIEPDVLLVDEVLAVGDTAFRNRCQTRMEQMQRNGVTMIFVSHNLNEVRNLCERTLMLFKGQTVIEGPTQKVLEKYHQTMAEKIRQDQAKDDDGQPKIKLPAGVRITDVRLLDSTGKPAEVFPTGGALTLRVFYNAQRRIERPTFEVEIVWAAEDWTAVVFNSDNDAARLPPIEGAGYVDLRIDPLLIEPNVYQFNIQVGDDVTPAYDQVRRVRFVVSEALPIPGVFGLSHTWSSGAANGNGKHFNGKTFPTAEHSTQGIEL